MCRFSLVKMTLFFQLDLLNWFNEISIKLPQALQVLASCLTNLQGEGKGSKEGKVHKKNRKKKINLGGWFLLNFKTYYKMTVSKIALYSVDK